MGNTVTIVVTPAEDSVFLNLASGAEPIYLTLMGVVADASQTPVTPDNLTNPAFTYTSGKLTQITYDGGILKNFTYYGNGKLRYRDLVSGASTKRREFIYVDGKLDHRIDTEF